MTDEECLRMTRFLLRLRFCDWILGAAWMGGFLASLVALYHPELLRDRDLSVVIAIFYIVLIVTNYERHRILNEEVVRLQKQKPQEVDPQ